MPQRYLSTDPNAGQSTGYLSTDPSAGGYLSTDPGAGSPLPNRLTRLAQKGLAEVEGRANLPNATGHSLMGKIVAKMINDGIIPGTPGEARLEQGSKEGLEGVYQILRHPLDTAKAMGSQALSAVAGIPDIASNLIDPDTRSSTLGGFGRGAFEGATMASTDEARKQPGRAVGRFVSGVVLPAVALKGAKGMFPRIVGAPAIAAEAAGAEAAAAEAGAAEAAAEAAKPSPNAGGRLVRGGEPASIPPNRSAPAAVAEAMRELAQPQPEIDPAFAKTAARRAPRILRMAPEAPPELPTPKPDALPASWRQFVREAAPEVAPEAQPAPIPNLPGIISKRTPKPGAVQTARNALGSREAAKLFGITPEDVRAQAPGPSRTPLKALLAEMDAEYTRHIHDERGAIDPKLLRTLGLAVGGGVAGSLATDDHSLAGAILGALSGAALANPGTTIRTLQQARMMGMLSGAALPKSALGNMGAMLTAAAEKGSLAPIREMLNLPENARNAIRGFRSNANPAHTAGIGKLNLPGRLMGAFDEATTQALQRAGLSLPEAQRLLLTTPNALGSGPLATALRSPLGRFALPFQNIPFNTMAEGISSLNELLPKSGASAMRRALTYGSGVAGAAAGTQTDNPLMLALIAALMGPRALPFALGAGLTAGPKVIQRVGGGLPDASWQDLYDPLKPINQPALLRLLQGTK